jgi:exopolysaccharide production protein ExoY
LKQERFYTDAQHTSASVGPWAIELPSRQTAPATRALTFDGKRLVDIVGALMALLAFAPIMLAVSAILLLRGSNIVFRHQRLGRNGKTFPCFKFCTMVQDADRVLRELLERDPNARDEWVRTHKLVNDPRVTWIGLLLRKSSIDELPQIFNVLRGEMSLIGPRPVTAEEIARYGRAARWYYAVRPGITGLWQVSGRNSMDYKRRVALDVFYVRNRCAKLDIRILLRTVYVVLTQAGAH